MGGSKTAIDVCLSVTKHSSRINKGLCKASARFSEGSF